MPIDWFTVVAQIFNFLILVWLLKRFLYKPILDALDAREARIAATLADAAKLKADAKTEIEDYQEKIAEFEAARAARMKAVEEEAQREHERLIQDSKQSIEAHRLRLEKSLKDEVEQLQNVIRVRTQDAVFSIARAVLEQLASESLEARLVDRFLESIPEMETSVKDAFANALKVSNEVMLRTAFALPEASKARIQESLKSLFGEDVTLEYHVVPALISGVELTSHGQKLSWSIDDYLDALQHQVEHVGMAQKVGSGDVA